MRKVLVLTLVVLMLLIPVSAFAAGGMNHGGNAQGAAVCVGQPDELPARNDPLQNQNDNDPTQNQNQNDNDPLQNAAHNGPRLP